jgi:hypothetical protein
LPLTGVTTPALGRLIRGRVPPDLTYSSDAEPGPAPGPRRPSATGPGNLGTVFEQDGAPSGQSSGEVDFRTAASLYVFRTIAHS